MTEAVEGSTKGPSEETEDLEPLEPDDRGKKVGPAPAFLSCPLLVTDSLRAGPSLGLSFSVCTRMGRPCPVMAPAWLPQLRRHREGLGSGAPPCTTPVPPCLRYFPTSHKPPRHHGRRIGKDGHGRRGRSRHAEDAGLGDHHGEGRQRALCGDERSHPLPAGARGRARSPSAAPWGPAACGPALVTGHHRHGT